MYATHSDTISVAHYTLYISDPPTATLSMYQLVTLTVS